MAAMVEITCACGCGKKRMVRVADRNRGWGRYFDKSCKARHQEARTGQFRKYLQGQTRRLEAQIGKRRYGDDIHPDTYGHIFASGDEGHGQE